jgi:hypothetical protein
LRKNLKKMVKFGILIDYFRIIDRQTGFWKYGPHISINQRNPAYANLVIEWEITEVGEDHRSWGGSQKLGRGTANVGKVTEVEKICEVIVNGEECIQCLHRSFRYWCHERHSYFYYQSGEY